MGIVWTKKHTYQLIGFLCIVLFLVSMFFALQKPVSVRVDGKVINDRVFFAGTVGDFLEHANVQVGEYDRVEPSLNSGVKKGTSIAVTRGFKVKVAADGETREIITTPISVKEAIKLADFDIGEKDIVKTVLTAQTFPDQVIEIIRVTEDKIEVEEQMPFQVEKTSDQTLEKGLTKTLRQGKNGIALNTVKITYHDGEEVKREVVDSKTIKEPQNKIIAMGSITSVSRGNQRFNFREAKYMEASAYTYTGYRTATGKNPQVGMVAVDPRVIPMGSRLYIEGYGYAQAADTGGAIKGNKIDVFMEDRAQCLSWGRRTVKVYVLE